jgi:hypothetical protein
VQPHAAVRANATEAATHAGNMREYALLVAVGAVGALLLLDVAVHDVRAVLRWRMLRILRALHLPPTASAFPRAQLNTLGPRPTMLLGPTGSGKSMKLTQPAVPWRPPTARGCPQQGRRRSGRPAAPWGWPLRETSRPLHADEVLWPTDPHPHDTAA